MGKYKTHFPNYCLTALPQLCFAVKIPISKKCFDEPALAGEEFS